MDRIHKPQLEFGNNSASLEGCGGVRGDRLPLRSGAQSGQVAIADFVPDMEEVAVTKYEEHAGQERLLLKFLARHGQDGVGVLLNVSNLLAEDDVGETTVLHGC